MSLSVCIPDLIAQGKIPAKRAEEIRQLYDELVQQHEGKFGRAAAEAMATEQALKHLEKANLVKYRQALLQMQAQKGWLDMRRAETGDGAFDFAAIEGGLVRLDKKIDAVRGSLFVTMDGFLAKHRRNLLGQVRNASDLEDVGRALFGESVSDLNARELADAMAQTMEIARQRANAAGASIGKLDSYGLPQRHDSKAVRAVDFETWRSHPAIERVKVRDLETGDVASGLRRETILREVYESIRTEGGNKAKPGQMFAGSLANRRGDPRVLHFDSFADWKDYQATYGAGDSIYDIFTGHIGAMARDIALMEELGPNPAATVRFMQDWYEKSVRLASDGSAESEKAIAKLNGRRDRIAALVDEMTGANKLPANERVALGFSALRAQQVAAKLGSAILSAVPDFAMLLHNSHFNRVPMMQTLGRYVKLWNPMDEGDRRLAVRLGLVTDDWINLSSSAARYTGEELTGEISRRLAEVVIRGQGLARHTRNAQWAFGMEYLSHLTHMRDRSLEALDPQIQRQFARHGISRGDWDAYRKTDARIERGSDWIFPTDAGKVGEKFLQMVLTETDFAIIVPDVRTRTFMNSNFKTGTWMGEIAKSSLLFKSFPMAIYNLHGRRMMEMEGAKGKVGYALPLFLLMVAGGALSAQLKTIANGKDPVPMVDENGWPNKRFLGKAIAQSGGLGLFGDLLYNSQNSFGGGLAATLLGPFLGQTVPNATDATVGNVIRMADGDDETQPQFAKDIGKAIEAEIPGRNIWYMRRAYELLIGDSIRRLTNPDFDEWVERQEKRAADEGTAYWAPPGQGLSGVRAPDFGNAFGEVVE